MTPVLGGRRSAPAVQPEDRGQARRFLRGRRELWASLLIGLCCLLVYNANGRAISAGDTYPARYLPFAIWQHHSLLLDPIAPLTAQGRGDTAFWMVSTPDGHTISLYPVVLPVLIAPLYLPAVGYLNLRGWTDWRLDHMARVMEKLSASLVAALSASLLYLLLRRRATAPTALLLTLAYAFGTTTWVISSQALWQHGMAQLLVIGALLLLTGPCTAPRALAAGLLCGLIAGNRPPDVILAAALGAYGLFWAGRRAALLVAAAALPMGLVLLYNLGVAGHFAGGYGLVGKATFFQHDLLSGLGGLLFSPTRGLFVFSPFLLFLVLAWRHLPRDRGERGERGLTLAISAGVVLQILLYAKTDWRAGISWGPRYLTDLLPLLVWMLVPVVAALRGFGRVCFLLAVGAAVAIEAIGAFWYTGATDSAIFAVASGPHPMRAAWDWRNAPFVAPLQHGLAPAELMLEMRGNLDAIEAGGRATSEVTAGQEVAAAGWALTGHATPWQVAIAIDGRQTGTSRTFFDRPDVRGTLHEASPAGWRIPLDTAGLAPGEHHLAAIAWASENGEAYYLAERKLTVAGTRGSFDAIEAGGRPISAVTAGQEVAAAGWALAGHATPWQVAVVIDGRQTVVSRTFFDRPDVRNALHEASPAGWRIPLSTAGLAPGEHRLTAFAWAFEKGEGHYLGERKLTVRMAPAAGGEDLDDSFRTAAARLRAHQQGPGYWLTASHDRAALPGAAPGDEHLPHRSPARSARSAGGHRPVSATACSAPASTSPARSRPADWCATMACQTLLASAPWDARSRPIPTTRRSSGGSLPATTAGGCRPPWRPSTDIAPARASTAPGSRRARPTSASTRAAIRTLPTSPSRCTCCCCWPRCSRRPAVRSAKLSARLSTRIGSGSTIEWRRWSRSCA